MESVYPDSRLCEYPGDDQISCPECNAKLKEIIVVASNVICPYCNEKIDRVISE